MSNFKIGDRVQTTENHPSIELRLMDGIIRDIQKNSAYIYGEWMNAGGFMRTNTYSVHLHDLEPYEDSNNIKSTINYSDGVPINMTSLCQDNDGYVSWDAMEKRNIIKNAQFTGSIQPVEIKINKEKNMLEETNLLDLANKVQLQEPQRTLTELGFTNKDNRLTSDGVTLLLQYLLEKNLTEFVNEVVNPIKKYQDEQNAKNK